MRLLKAGDLLSFRALKSLELNFADGSGMSFYDPKIFDVLGFQGVPDPNRAGFVIGNNDKVNEQTQPIKGGHPVNNTAGTSLSGLTVIVSSTNTYLDLKHLFSVSIIQKS